MRTKTLLLTAAVIAVGAIASQAQVYSVNAVGYVNKTLPAGYSPITNPLNGTNNLLNTVLPNVPADTYILPFDAANQRFGDPIVFLDGVGWLPDTATLNPGEGVFINLPGPGTATLTFVGEVPQGNSLSNHIFGNYTLMGHIVPQSIPLDAAGVNFPAQGDDYILKFNPVTQRYGDPIVYLDGVGWLPEAPSFEVGEAFFYNTAAGAGRPWVRSFTVNN